MSIFIVSIYLMTHVCLLSATTRELRLLGLLPMTGDGWSGGGSCLPAVEMALDDVNNNINILTDYNLSYRWTDTKCNAGLAVYKMFQFLNADPPYHMLVGAGCSVESEATSQVSHLWNLTQFSYGCSSPILSDRKRFPKFFRLSLPDQKHNPARIDLMREFNWEKVATINQALEFFSSVMDDFVERVDGTNITILSQEIFVNNPRTRVRNLKNRDARIIMTAMYEDKARKVLCAAYRIGLYGPKIVWVFVGWFSTTFWKVGLEHVRCTADEMAEAAEGSFITGPVYSNPIEERGIANMTASEFAERYYSHPSYNIDSQNYDSFAYQCYDHIWVVSMAFECAVRRMEAMGHRKTLDMFTYSDSDINDIIFECMGNTSLTGVSGRVFFTSGADPNRIVKIERIQGGARQLVGLYRQDKDPTYFEWIEDAIKWKDGSIPRDSTLVTYEEIAIPRALYATMTSLSGFGIGLALAFLAFNFTYRNNSYVKMSSPNINNVLLLGCILCYCTVFFKTTEIESATVCKFRIVTFSLGFTITFGALFSKTWRVYRIFTNKKLLKRTIKDYQLLGIIAVLVVLVSVVLILWESIGPHTLEIKFLPKEVYVIGNDAEVHPFVRVCQSNYSAYLGWALYTIEGGLLSFGAFLAWETRHVKIEAMNDSHQIGLCVYTVVILSVVGLTFSLLLEDQQVVMYGVTSGSLIIGTTLTQTVIFIPKIQAVRNKVAGADCDVAVGIGFGLSQASTVQDAT